EQKHPDDAELQPHVEPGIVCAHDWDAGFGVETLERLDPSGPVAYPTPAEPWVLLDELPHLLPGLGAAGQVAALAQQAKDKVARKGHGGDRDGEQSDRGAIQWQALRL